MVLFSLLAFALHAVAYGFFLGSGFQASHWVIDELKILKMDFQMNFEQGDPWWKSSTYLKGKSWRETYFWPRANIFKRREALSTVTA